MDQIDKARHFTGLHAKGNPCVLYNIWDAGSALAVEQAGAKAIATGSWSVAAAQGYEDGEAIPIELLATIAQRICSTVALPVSVDFEGGYAEDPSAVAENAQRVIAAGAIGINFEDRIVRGRGVYAESLQCKRIAAIRELANRRGIPFFINARTDLFLQASDAAEHRGLMDAVKSRATAYRDAGASGFFAPGLVDESLISELCEHSELPVNVMMMDGAPTIKSLAELGVARVSFGPSPYRQIMKLLSANARDRQSA